MTREPLQPARVAVALVLAAGCAALGVASCASDPSKGYVWGSSYDQGITTVHIPIFQNSTFTRGVETELTDAIIKEIQSTTPWKVTTAGAADASLTGAIIDSELRSLSLGRSSGLVQEQGVVLKLNFEFRDNRTGKRIVARENFSGADVFIPAQNVNERIETGYHAAIAKLAKDIVGELRAGW